MNAIRKQHRLLLGLVAAASVLSGSSVQAEDPLDNLRLDGRGVPVGCDLIEGDIIICGTPESRANYVTDLWTNGIVPYEFDANVNAENRQRTVDAMDEWAAVAGLSFEPYDLSQHGWAHIRVRDSNGDEEPTNSSAVGMQGGEQVINIANWGTHFTIVHEFGHALGYWHEQSRPDRDDYVQVEWDNIIDGKSHNFNKHPLAGYYGPYDFESIMHYGQCAFSCCGNSDPNLSCGPVGCGSDPVNCRTITVLSPYTQWQDNLGNRSYMSFWDAQVMSFLYPFPDYHFVGSGGYMFGSGTYWDPWGNLQLAYSAYAPEGSTLWVLQPGDWVIGTTTLDRPMTIRSGEGVVRLVP